MAELEQLPPLDVLPELEPLEALEPMEALEPLENVIQPKPLVKAVVKIQAPQVPQSTNEHGLAPGPADFSAPVVYTHEAQFAQTNPHYTSGVVIISRQDNPRDDPAKETKPKRWNSKSKKPKNQRRDESGSARDAENKEGKQNSLVDSGTTMKGGDHKAPAADSQDMGDPADYFRIENWYEDLKDHTFKTVFLDLSLPEAKVITQYRENHKMHMQMMAWQIKAGKIPAPPSEAVYREQVDKELTSKLKPEDQAVISAIVRKLEAAIESMGCKHGAFVRLSTRSPKDSALSSEKMKRLVRTAIQQSSVTDPQEAMNEDLNIFVTACSEALRVESGQEATDLLLHSNRVMEDLMRCELAIKDVWSMKLIVREWWQGLFPPFEFRCFVYRQRMTAISQYYSLCYLRELVDNKAKMQELILAKWEQLKSNIKVDSYTIDFALSRDLSEVWVVELNHLPPRAGTALFDFTAAQDRTQIETGLGPGATEPVLEFRIRTGICSNIATNAELGLAAIHAPVRIVIDEARGRPSHPATSLPAASKRRGCIIS